MIPKCFLTYILTVIYILYHTEEEACSDQPGSSGPDSMHMLYKDFLKEAEKEEPAQPASQTSTKENHHHVLNSSRSQFYHDRIQPHASIDDGVKSPSHNSQESSSLSDVTDRCADQSLSILDNSTCLPQTQVNQKTNQLSALNRKMDVSQPIGTLISPTNAGSQQNRPVTVTGQVELVPEDEIRKNKETEEEIKRIPRFQNYQPGEPSNVSVNHSKHLYFVQCQHELYCPFVLSIFAGSCRCYV